MRQFLFFCPRNSSPCCVPCPRRLIIISGNEFIFLLEYAALKLISTFHFSYFLAFELTSSQFLSASRVVKSIRPYSFPSVLQITMWINHTKNIYIATSTRVQVREWKQLIRKIKLKFRGLVYDYEQNIFLSRSFIFGWCLLLFKIKL